MKIIQNRRFKPKKKKNTSNSLVKDKDCYNGFKKKNNNTRLQRDVNIRTQKM